jgi:Tfp pilus assembly protein FimV
MAAHGHAVHQKRGELLARSRQLRAQLATESRPLQRTLALADRVRDRARWLAANPQWLAALAAVPILLRPRRALAWGLKLWWGWRLVRRVQALIPPARP